MRSQLSYRFDKKVKYGRRIAAALVLILVTGIAVYGLLPSATRPIRDGSGTVVPGSIARLEMVNLGGFDQWLLLRGHSPEAPILLVLHGGPGSGLFTSARHYQAELEEHFLVVNWDQRGAGKSWNTKLKPEDITPDALLGDTLELAQWLTREFDQEKVFVLGHSWGSYLALRAVQARPDLFAGVITAGQMVDVQKSEKISWQFVHDQAVARDNTKALKDLEKIGQPPYSDLARDILVQRKWLVKFGGAVYKGNFNRDVMLHMLLGREYNLADVYRYFQGQRLSGYNLMPPLGDLNMFTLVPSLEVPVWITNGRHDYLTPFTLTEEYYDALAAPHKELVWFEHSAHSPLFEEPAEFNQMIITRVLPWADK